MPPRRNPAGIPAPQAKEQASIVSPPGLPDLQLLRASFLTRSFPRHSHEGYGSGSSSKGPWASSTGASTSWPRPGASTP